eukprot:3723730-Rhodomonas_salina.1
MLHAMHHPMPVSTRRKYANLVVLLGVLELELHAAQALLGLHLHVLFTPPTLTSVPSSLAQHARVCLAPLSLRHTHEAFPPLTICMPTPNKLHSPHPHAMSLLRP